MAERPQQISMPHSTGLRSAMKQPSQPNTPLLAPTSTNSPPSSTSPLLGLPLTATSSGGSSSLSPPIHPRNYLPKVSFDTFEDSTRSMFSFTLQVKSEGYKRNRSTRVFLCAASPDESGSQALGWVMESLVQDGDELVVLRGFDTEELVKDQDAVREDAKYLMAQIQKLNTDEDPNRKLSIIVEFIAGKVTDTIERLIALYRPDSLIVGTKGQRGVKASWVALSGMGSVSKYCLSHSPVPVIVVRPERKVQKTMQKRRADPKRGIHFEDMKTPSVSALPSPGISTP